MSKYARLFNGNSSAQTAAEPLSEDVSSAQASPSVVLADNPTEDKTPSVGRRVSRRLLRRPGHTSRAQPAPPAVVDPEPPSPDDPTQNEEEKEKEEVEQKETEAKEEEEEEEDFEEALDDLEADGATRYSCDLCPHLSYASYDALEAHALEQHAELLRDYVHLRPLVGKLAPLWQQIIDRKAERIARWGRKVFAVAKERDAGPAKMAEARRARAQLAAVVRRWNAAAEVFIFGSSVVFGVWDGVSDIDFAVVDTDALEAGMWPPHEKNAVRSITELLRRAGFAYVNLEPIGHARVPIIKHHASAPIRIPREPTEAGSTKEPDSEGATGSSDGCLEAENIISRSVRYTLTQPASHADRAMLEGSIRAGIGAEAVQQIWWNRTSDTMCITCDTTTNAIHASMCDLTFANPSLRARVRPLHGECRPELYNLDFDLSFRAFGIRNSELLRRYLLYHPCARPGAIVLKDWSKTSGVNNSVNGYLTSYAINIMWIYFLVQRGVVKYVDPIDDIPESLRCYQEGLADGPRYQPMLDPSWSAEEKRAFEWEAGRLLMEFFFYYAYEFDWANHVVSLNRRGITTKKMLGWDSEDVAPPNVPIAPAPPSSAAGSPRRGNNPTRYSFCIEDPYEENLNLGRHMGITKSLRVRTEFCRALLSLCKDGESVSCVFAATDRHKGGAAAAAQGPTASLLPAPDGLPGRLPQKVLYQLMAVCTTEMALARQAQRAGVTPPPRRDAGAGSHASASVASPAVFPSLLGGGSAVGVSEAALREAFRRAAPLAFELASKAWNWPQLIHRLGFKIHRGVVLPRREVGVRRLTAPPPWGIAPSTGEGGEGTALREDGPGRLSSAMIATLSEGFLRLAPAWVAWTTPWAALHLRAQRFGSPEAAQKDGAAAEKAACGTASEPGAVDSAEKIGLAGGNGGGPGPLKPTRRVAARWVPSALGPHQGGFKAAKLLRRLLRR